MQFIRSILISVGMLFLAACATQQNVQLSDHFWKTPKQRVAVVTTKSPQPQLYKMGQQGVLDLAINNMMTNDLDKYLSHTDLSWYHQLPVNFAEQLRTRHVDAKVYSNQLSSDPDKYRDFAMKIESDKLLVIQLNAFGAKRDYYAFIPSDAPSAYCVMTGELIDTTNKQTLWRYTTTITQPVQGPWDQPPNYPNLNQAIKVAINDAQQELLDNFFSGH